MPRLTALQVAGLLREHLEERRPLSVIRLGDGESRMIGWPDHTPRPLLVAQLSYWFGRTDFSDDELWDMRNDLCDAIDGADVLGLPRPDQVAKNADYANVEKYLDFYRLGQTAQHTNASLHRELQERELYELVISAAPQLYTVTCRDVGEQLSQHFDVPVVQIPIPGEGREVGPTDHYQTRFAEVMRTLSRPLKGKLVLVGAGILGKVYCECVKRSGGVALDVGSVFDGWAGTMNSRSYLAMEPEVYAL